MKKLIVAFGAVAVAILAGVAGSAGVQF